MVSPEPSSVQVPRVPELGIPKDARVLPVKVELLKMEAPERYVSSIKKTPLPKGLLLLYMIAELMPLSLDEAALVVNMLAPRVAGPVMK